MIIGETFFLISPPFLYTFRTLQLRTAAYCCVRPSIMTFGWRRTTNSMNLECAYETRARKKEKTEKGQKSNTQFVWCVCNNIVYTMRQERGKSAIHCFPSSQALGGQCSMNIIRSVYLAQATREDKTCVSMVSVSGSSKRESNPDSQVCLLTHANVT